MCAAQQSERPCGLTREAAPLKAPFSILATILVAFASDCAIAATHYSDTWVSITGNDANACNQPINPCRTIGTSDGALSKTLPGGIVHVLPGNYNLFFITESVSIIAEPGGQTRRSTTLQAISLYAF